MKPYYRDEFITIWHADCRDLLPTVADHGLILTDPPYTNGEGHFSEMVSGAQEVLAGLHAKEVLCFGSELMRPPVSLPLVAVHIWHRTNVNGKIYEPVYHFAADGRKRRSDVLRGPAIFAGAGPGCQEYLGHPTQKPTYIMRRLIERMDDGIICDPFAGSGSTLRAAKALRRRAIGIEIVERYCEIAAHSLRQEVLPLI